MVFRDASKPQIIHHYYLRPLGKMEDKGKQNKSSKKCSTLMNLIDDYLLSSPF